MSKTFQIERLRGRENFDTWKRAAQSYLTIQGYWACTKSEVNEASSEVVLEKHEKALSELFLLVEPQLYSYIDGCTNLKEAWNALVRAFSDTGTCRKVSILQQWTSTKFNDCSSMENYVNTMTSLWSKVKSVGFTIDEEVAASLLLAGLPTQYQPLILGLENTKEKLTLDFVKNILLQGAITSDELSGSALFVKGKKRFKNKKPIKCYNCGGPHYAKKCNKNKNSDKKLNNASANFCGDDTVLYSAFFAGNSVDWYFDSGATAHMSNRNDNLQNQREPTKKSITVANNDKISVLCAGDITQTVETGHGKNDLLIKNVQYVPNLCVNLLSVSQIVKKHNTVVFSEHGCTVYNQNKKIVATGSLENDLFKLNMIHDVSSRKISADAAFGAMHDNDINLWHRRLGHMSVSNMHFIKNSSNVKLNCVVCAEGKQTRAPFPSSGSRATELLQIVHSDVCGPMSTNSLGGNKFYVSFIDDHSRMVTVFLIKNKSQVFDCFVKFKNLCENQLNRKIKTLRTDNGGEYCSRKFQELCEKNGIVHQKSCPYTPQQNGLAERYNRTIVERARCMLFDANLPRSFWGEAILTAVKIMNSTLNTAIKAIPSEVWYGKDVDLSSFRVFGCKAMAKIPDVQRKKFDKKSIECIFVGYAENQKGYRLLQKSSNKLIISRDVIFFENEIAMKNSSTNSPFLMTEAVPKANVDESREDRNDTNLSNNLYDLSIEESVQNASNDTFTDANGTVANSTVIDLTEDHRGASTSNDLSANSSGATNSDDSVVSTVDDRRADPDYRAQVDINTNERPSTRSLSRLLNPFNFSNFAFCSIADALESSESNDWKQAMKEEIDAHISNHTWDIVDLPPNRVPIKSKWIFKKKTDAQGNVVRYKARLVVKGCSQKEGIDYTEIYSPVVRYASIRYLISLAAQFDLDIFQMDAITAFLQGELQEEIYMRQPEYYNDGTNKVCRLRKSIYGLKQASRVWNLKLRGVLLSAGYKSSQMDPCIFYQINGNDMIFIAIYVDDVLYFTNSKELKASLQRILTAEFKMKDLGEAECCVGLRITRDRANGVIFLDQQKYIAEILEKFNMTNCKIIDTPSDPNQRLKRGESNDVDFNSDSIPYQQAVGSLMYLTQGTRPDLAFAINNVCRFNTCYTREHWTAVKRIMRYLQGSLNLRLSFSKNKCHKFLGYSDADWGSDVNDRRSVTGFVFIRSGGAISWASKRQPTVALSTAEAEYMAISSCAQEAMWLKQLEDEIFGTSGPMNLLCDNQSAICIAENNGYSSRSKHIDLRHHFIREKIMDNSCTIHYVSTEKNAADVFTKALNKQKFAPFANSIGLS